MRIKIHEGVTPPPLMLYCSLVPFGAVAILNIFILLIGGLLMGYLVISILMALGLIGTLMLMTHLDSYFYEKLICYFMSKKWFRTEVYV